MDKSEKRRHRWMIALVLLLLAGLYTVRVIEVNRQWGRGTEEYMAGGVYKSPDGLEISLGEGKLYHIAAFLRQYPAAGRFFQYRGSIYEKAHDETGLRAIENILCVEMTVENTTKESRVIAPTMQFRLYSGAYGSVLADNRIFMEVNQIGDTLELRGGAEVSFLLCYDMDKRSFRKGNYKDLLKREYSVLVHGFPDMCYLSLKPLTYMDADEEALRQYEQLVSADDSADLAVREDTPEASLLSKGSEYVTGGVYVSIESVCVTKNNVHEFEGFDEAQLHSLLREVEYHSERGTYSKTGSVDEEGNILPQWNQLKQEYYDSEVYKPCVIFVTLELYNAGRDKKIVNDILISNLYYYIGKRVCEMPGTTYIAVENVEEAQGFAYVDYVLEGHARGRVTIAYECVENQEKGMDFEKDPMWLQFGCMSPGKVNLKKGNPGRGIFLQIQ